MVHCSPYASQRYVRTFPSSKAVEHCRKCAHHWLSKYRNCEPTCSSSAARFARLIPTIYIHIIHNLIHTSIYVLDFLEGTHQTCKHRKKCALNCINRYSTRRKFITRIDNMHTIMLPNLRCNTSRMRNNPKLSCVLQRDRATLPLLSLSLSPFIGNVWVP